MVFVHTNEEDLEFVQDLVSGDMPDRVLAILAGVILDERLFQAIKANLHDGDIKGTTIFQELFRDGAPVGSFKARINLGFALGLYGADVYSDLYIINKIRNKFAHTRSVKDFDTQAINDLIKNLKTPELHPITKEVNEMADVVSLLSSPSSHLTGERKRFVRAVEVLSLLLLMGLGQQNKPPKPKF